MAVAIVLLFIKGFFSLSRTFFKPSKPRLLASLWLLQKILGNFYDIHDEEQNLNKCHN